MHDKNSERMKMKQNAAKLGSSDLSNVISVSPKEPYVFDFSATNQGLIKRDRTTLLIETMCVDFQIDKQMKK